VRFHIKDFKFDTRQWVPLREGSIDWKEIRAAIGEIGYNGWITTEVGKSSPAEREMTHEAWLRETSKRVDQIIAGV
jgi:sugar phosphate isomerase/epimerase